MVKGNRVMKPEIDDSTIEFINLAVKGQRTNAEVLVEQAFLAFDTIGKKLQELGISDDKIIEIRHNNFSITCCECGMTINGDNFAKAFLVKITHENATIVSLKHDNLEAGQELTTAIFSDGENVIARGHGKIFRLIMGKCLNETCECSRVLMRWEPIYQSNPSNI